MKRVGLTALVVVLAMLAAACGDEPEDTSGTPDAVDCPSEAVETESGLVYEDLTCGDGEEAQRGDVVSVHYVGTLEDGSKFDASRDRGAPYEFKLGAGDVIAGWDEGVEGMKIGGTRKLTIPPDLAYGESGYPPVIPPNATLTFEIELLEILDSGE